MKRCSSTSQQVDGPPRLGRCGPTGSNGRYQRGCRCVDCRTAHRESERGRKRRAIGLEPLDITTLRVTCWCESITVGVPAREVQAGKTRSCGAPGCTGPDEEET